MSIRVLPDALINKIAAGEVIEDPLSCVKELVENSIDAGAKAIEIELVGGGYRLIRISDDGSGMAQDDAVLCFERHATSKIRAQEDLFQLSTMGFRGEALAAIAAVSKIELKTAVQDKAGVFVDIQAGKLLRVHPLQRSRGTTIELRDLFFSTPARRKFQKSCEASSARIEKWLLSFSLGYPDIAFSFREGNKVVDFQNRLELVFGPSFNDNHLPIQIENGGMGISGVLGAVSLHRPQRSGQIVFINGRIVDAPLVSLAVKEAYGMRLPEGRHPLFFLQLQLPCDSIDVNVHPQKREVRFRDENQCKWLVRSAVNKVLEQKKLDLLPTYVSFESLQDISWTLHEASEKIEQQCDLPIEHRKPQILALLWHYALLETRLLVDLQRAVERILYEQTPEKRISSEPLLIPIRLELSRWEAEELRRKEEQLASMGIGVTEFGERLFLIERIPAGWSEIEVASAVTEFLSEQKSENYPKVFRRCIKKQFSLPEAEEILKSLFNCKTYETSPSGQPIMVQLEESDITACLNKESKRS